VEDLHPRVPRGVVVHDLAAVVGRPVVDRDDLHVGVGLAKNGIQALAEISLNPICRDDNAQLAHVARTNL
jgi:hypothetical protein